MKIQHVSEEDIDLYCSNRLPADHVASIEEHLLICSACRDSVSATDLLIVAIREHSVHGEAFPLPLFPAELQPLHPFLARLPFLGSVNGPHRLRITDKSDPGYVPPTLVIEIPIGTPPTIALAAG